MSDLQVFTDIQDEVHDLIEKVKVLERFNQYKEIKLFLEKISRYVQEIITEQIQYHGPRPADGEEAEDG